MRNKSLSIIIAAILLNTTLLVLGETPAALPLAEKAPVIDGILDEPVWQSAAVFTRFKTFKPTTGKEPSLGTTVHLAYDKKTLYLGIVCDVDDADRIKRSIANRDSIATDDWVAVELDTYNKAQSGFIFKVNALGIQSDGTIDPDRIEDLALDMIWESEGVINDDNYTVELAIPFQSLRFRNTQDLILKMGIIRNISQTSEWLVFPEFDPDQGSYLAQRQPILIRGAEIHKPIEIIPTLVSTGSWSKQESWVRDKQENELGLTAKIGITSDLTVDATYNPDFSQVESDAGQVDVNLRHALYFEEKRPFFMEGMENFDVAGFRNFWHRPINRFVNTRTIVDPEMGLKLNGRIGENNVISAIYAQDEYPKLIAEAAGETGENATFNIIRYRRQLKRNSYVGGLFTRRAHDGQINTVMGADGRIRFNRKHRIEFFAFLSEDKNGADGEDHTVGSALAIQYSYSSSKLNTQIGLNHISRDFNTQVGQIRRTGITYIPTYSFYNVYPGLKLLPRLKFEHYAQISVDRFSKHFEHTFNWLGFCFYMPHQTRGWVGASSRDEYFEGIKYDKDYYGYSVRSQVFNQLYVSFIHEAGKEIDYEAEFNRQGRRTEYVYGLTYQPTGNFTAELDVTQYKFYRDLDGEKIYDYKIIRLKNTLQLNRRFFLRAIVEHNSYYDRINTEFLASYTYVPGTVIQLGYGEVLEKTRWELNTRVPSDSFEATRKGFFFKISYLFRR